MQMTGIIIKGIGGFYYVEAADKIYECKLRGIFRKEGLTPLAGDNVKITVRVDDENTIDEILPRTSVFIRPPVANADRLIIIASVLNPRTSTLIIDKMTVIAQLKGIETAVVVTKTDLGDASDLINIYKQSGFDTFSFSNSTGGETEEIKDYLKGHISVLAGNSGVGKSTLLNFIDPTIEQKTDEISKKLGRGKHTTRTSELFKVNGGYIVDTPGFTSLDFQRDAELFSEDLQDCFKDFLPHIGKCKFSSCIHLQDKGCAIVDAVEKGIICQSRYQSYVSIFNEIKDLRKWNQ